MVIVIISLILALAILGIGIYLFKAFSRKKAQTKQSYSSDETIYSQEKNNKKDKKLTLKERIDLSWNFLYEITEIIMNKFSTEDKATINQIGTSLLNSGMRYEHVVELSMQPNRSKTQVIEQEREQAETKQRAI